MDDPYGGDGVFDAEMMPPAGKRKKLFLGVMWPAKQLLEQAYEIFFTLVEHKSFAEGNDNEPLHGWHSVGVYDAV